MKSKIKGSFYKNIIDLCEKHGFLKRSGAKLKIGPNGGLLLANLQNEWFYSTVTNRDCNVFLNASCFVDTFDYAKEMSGGRLPFGIAEVFKCDDALKDDKIDFAENLEDSGGSLRCTTFVAPSQSTHIFHQLQRQRRMWWRIFSASPGRYSLTDIQNDETGGQYVEIHAEYPWGSHLIESLRLNVSGHQKLTSEQLQTKDGRKNIETHHITSDIRLSTMILNTLCDAYDEPVFQGETRPMFRFHRKLSPYKISFAISATKSTGDLTQLAIYLCKKLRTNHISSLLLPAACRNSLEVQWLHFDQLGVPYTVLLNDNTLKNGIAQLRSRDTTLKEQVHVSDLPNYVDQLFRNY